MVFLVFFYYYLIFGNVLFLFLLGRKSKELLANKNLLFFVSFGSAPLIIGLIYYYSVYLFPSKNDIFYSAIIFLTTLAIFLCSFKNLPALAEYYKDLAKKIKSINWKDYRIIALTLLVVTYFIIIFCQSIYYPAMDDQSAYINQGKAAYYAKHDLQKSFVIQADGKNTLFYNSAIRPGIISYFDATILLDKQQISNQNYYSYKIFSFYYYLLLFGLFIFAIKRAGGIKNYLHLFMTSSLFLFFWILSRMALFNMKETSIFFFTLLSLLLLDLVVKKNNRGDLRLAGILGLVCGLNIFVNVHGLVIFVFLLTMILIFGQYPFRQRLLSGLMVFVSVVIFSAFDIFTMFASILTSGFRSNALVDSAFKSVEKILAHFRPSQLQQGNPAQATDQLSSLDDLHKDLYDAHSNLSIYLKGKLQLLTNFGFYGLRGWLVLLTAAVFLKKIWNNNLLKLILVFIFVYYIVVLDPFSINRYTYAVVLFGSPNYSTLVVFLGLVLVGAHLMDIYNFLVRKIFSGKTYFLLLFLVTSGLLIIVRDKLVSALTNHLYLLVTIEKALSFYRHKVDLFITFILVFCLISAFMIIISYFNKVATKVFVVVIFVMVMIAPFFLFEPGKIPLRSTFVNIGKDNEYKLKNSLILSDGFNLYFNSKKLLPANSIVVTENHNIMAYNNYFQMKMADTVLSSAKKEIGTFFIGTICPKGSRIIQTVGTTNLCETLE